MVKTVSFDENTFLFPPKPTVLTQARRKACKAAIKSLLVKQNTVMVAHYYCDPDIQSLAEETGGFVGDSLEMARFGKQHPCDTLLVCGVRFMGETAKILTPDKKVIMPTLDATCSLDLSCPEREFAQFCDDHPERTVVVYANTSAAVKARANWVVTSSIAVDVIEHLDSLGESILWAPDRHLGNYVARKTGADMLLWKGTCIVHDEFKSWALNDLLQQYPDAALLVHPESPQAIVERADAVGSTSQLIKAAQNLPNQQLIVATDHGIFYKMQQACPDKKMLGAPTGGHGATCRSCAHCPWMAMNSLVNIELALNASSNHEIVVDTDICEKALVPIDRMMAFAEASR